MSKAQRKRIKDEEWEVSQSIRILQEICRRLLRCNKEELLEYYWFEVTNLIHAAMNLLITRNVDMHSIHFMSSILQMQAKRDPQFPRKLIKSLDRQLLFAFVDHVLFVDMDFERDYWGMVRYLLLAGMLQDQRLNRITEKMCHIMRNSVLDDKLDHDLAQLTIKMIPLVNQTSTVDSLFQVVVQKIKLCFGNKLEYQPSLKALLRALILLLMTRKEFQKNLNDSKFLTVIYTLLADIKDYFLSAQWYLTPNTHPIFGIITNMLQVCSILEKTSNQTIQYDAFTGSISNYLKWLILSEYKLEDLCSSDLIHPKAFKRDEMVLILTPDHVQSIVEHLVLLIKLERISIENCCDVDFLPSLLGLLQLVLSQEYQSVYLERAKEAQGTVLYLLVLLLEKTSGMESLKLLPKVLYEHISEPLGISIREYFHSNGGSTDNPKRILQFVSLMILDPYCRKCFKDDQFFKYLVSPWYCERLCALSFTEEVMIGILLFKAIENSLKDSAIRFQVRKLTNEGGLPCGIIEFLLKNIDISLQSLREGQGSLPYMNLVFSKSASLLNEYFGYDASVTDLLLLEDHSNCLLHSLVNSLGIFMESKLALDPLESIEIEFSSDTLANICHLIDAVLRSEKGRETFIKKRLVRSLTSSMIRLDHATAPSVLEKVIIRLCTDSTMVHRMVEYGGYCDVFECLLNPRQQSLGAIENGIFRNYSELYSRLMGLLDYATQNKDYKTQCRTALSIGYVCPLPLIQSIIHERQQQDSRFPRSLGLRVWDLIFANAYADGELHEAAEGCLSYLSKKIPSLPLRNTAIMSEQGTLMTLLDCLVNLPVKDRWMRLPEREPNSLVFHFPEQDISQPIIHMSRQLLATESPVFEAMLNGGFSESNQSTYEVREATPQLWLVVVLWMTEYRTWKITSMIFDEETLEENCETVLQLFQIANRYLIQSLLDACHSWIADALEYSMAIGNTFLPVVVYQWLVESKVMMESSKWHEFLMLCVRACICTLPKKYNS
jgi:hypothetical protein